MLYVQKIISSCRVHVWHDQGDRRSNLERILRYRRETCRDALKYKVETSFLMCTPIPKYRYM